MSYADGMAAINLEMPARIPRTEYSADSHWQLVSAVTGLAVSQASPDDVKIRARKAFMKAWSYDLCWSILISRQEFGDQRTRMGHAVYAAEGADYDDRISVLFDDPEAALSFDPKALYPSQDQAALVRRFNDHYAANCAFFPDAVNMTGIYITCMSGLIDIFGWNTLLTAAGIDSEAFGQMTNRYADWILPYFEALALSDAPVVMVHDDIVWTSGAFIHPQWYRRFIFPNYRRFMRPLLDCGKKVLFTSDGTYTDFITDLADCGFHGFVFEPTTDLALLAEKYGQTHVLVGNADTRILLQGDRAAIRAEVARCLDIGRRCPGFFLAVGNHIPANTPVENALWYQAAYEELCHR
ncbi:MAG: uroporphyrinogen decarboxylase family protein [Clostridiales bacterium]|nr:uroporphyrinogen decarboxylase family protein [Clostridiales bacterium]